MKDDTASADAPTTNPASASTTSQPTTPTARPARPPPNHVLMARRDEAERLANRKRSSSSAAEDGPHEPGRAARDPGQAASTAASSSDSGAPGMQGPSSATRGSSGLRREGDGPVAHGLAGTKRRAKQEPEERANAYQCTDVIADDSLMHMAKGVIRQAGIPDANWEPVENDTVGSMIVMKHPGPIVNAREITVKDKQW